MHILIVTQYFWPESFVVNGLVSDLKIRGHDVEVLTGLPNYPSGVIYNGYSLFKGPWTEVYGGATVHRVFLFPRGVGFLRLAINYFSFVIGGSLRALFLKNKYDIILCFALSPITSCLPAILLRCLRKIPLVVWVQDLWPESISAVGAVKSEKVINLTGKLVRFIYQRCDVILTQSQAFRNSVLKWGGTENKIHYIPNWAEPFVENEIIPEWVEQLPKGFKIGFAGNIGKAQDMATLIETAELLRQYADIKWIIVGDGSEKAWLDSEIKKRKLEDIIFTVGKKPYNEMLPFFSTCDTLYVSLTDEFIFSLTIPSKIQAYMSAAKPIVASLNGEGARILAEAEAGLSASSESPTELSKVILQLKEMSEPQRRQLGLNGLKYFKENFEKSRIVSQIEEILNKTLREKN